MSARLNKGAARAVADISEGVVHASVEIAASAERVFRALTSEELVAWWSTHSDYQTTKWQGDLRVGGAWRVDGVGADGTPFHVGGEFLEVNPPRKLVHTWRADWERPHVTTVTYRLEPIPSGTRVSVRPRRIHRPPRVMPEPHPRLGARPRWAAEPFSRRPSSTAATAATAATAVPAARNSHEVFHPVPDRDLPARGHV